MHELLTLVTIAGIYAMVLVSPGPNFLVLTQSAVSESRRHALYTGLGISCGSALLATLAAMGMGLLLAQFAWLHRAMQVLGGGYLIYIGIKIWRSAKQPLPEKIALGQRRSYAAAFRYGAMTNLTNPKAMVFFTTIFATLVGPALPMWVKFASIAEIFVLSTLWNFTLATLFSHSRIQHAYRNAKTGISRLTGGLLSGLGIQMLLTK